MKAHETFKYIRPDEVAECWDGVTDSLYSALWDMVSKYDNKHREWIEDIGPDDVVGINSVSKFWRFFSAEHQALLNKLAKEGIRG